MDSKLKNDEHKWGRELTELMTIPYRRGKKSGHVSLDYEYELLVPRDAKRIKDAFINGRKQKPRYDYNRINVKLLRTRAEALKDLRKRVAAGSFAQTRALRAVEEIEGADPATISPASSRKQRRIIQGLYLQKIDEALTSIDLLLAAKTKHPGDFQASTKALYGDLSEQDLTFSIQEAARFLAMKAQKAQKLPPARMRVFTSALSDAYDALADLGLSTESIYIPPASRYAGTRRKLSADDQAKILNRAADYINELLRDLPIAFTLRVDHEPSRASFAITYEAEDGLLTGALLKVPNNPRRLIVKGRGLSVEKAYEHEINTHLLRMVNGIANGLSILESMPNHIMTEEGLAVFNAEEAASLTSLPVGLRAPNKVLPTLLIGLCTARSYNFSNLYDLATTLLLPSELAKHGPRTAERAARDRAYTLVFRAKRGTDLGPSVYTKDLMYFKGLQEVTRLVQARNGKPEFLFAGKVGIQHEGALKALGLDRPPFGKRFDIPDITSIAKEVGVEF